MSIQLSGQATTGGQANTADPAFGAPFSQNSQVGAEIKFYAGIPADYNNADHEERALEEMLDAQENQSTASQLVSAEYPQPVVVYGRALRTIGQDLTELFPKILEIKVEGVNFIAAGQSHPDPFRMRNLSSGTTFWRKLIGQNVARFTAMEALAAKSFERIYSPAEIDRLDLLYSAGRAGQVGRADSYSLAERLRVMGNIIDRCRGRLDRARKNADNLFVDYWDQNGEFKTARLTTVIMYRNDQDPSVSGAAPRQLWEGYDF